MKHEPNCNEKEILSLFEGGPMFIYYLLLVKVHNLSFEGLTLLLIGFIYSIIVYKVDRKVLWCELRVV